MKIPQTLYFGSNFNLKKFINIKKKAPNYGIFITNSSDSSKGTWLETNRSLEYYLLKNGVSL